MSDRDRLSDEQRLAELDFDPTTPDMEWVLYPASHLVYKVLEKVQKALNLEFRQDIAGPKSSYDHYFQYRRDGSEIVIFLMPSRPDVNIRTLETNADRTGVLVTFLHNAAIEKFVKRQRNRESDETVRHEDLWSTAGLVEAATLSVIDKNGAVSESWTITPSEKTKIHLDSYVPPGFTDATMGAESGVEQVTDLEDDKLHEKSQIRAVEMTDTDDVVTRPMFNWHVNFQGGEEISLVVENLEAKLKNMVPGVLASLAAED